MLHIDACENFCYNKKCPRCKLDMIAPEMYEILKEFAHVFGITDDPVALEPYFREPVKKMRAVLSKTGVK